MFVDVGETETATLAEVEKGMGMEADMSGDGRVFLGDGGGMNERQGGHW